MTNGSNGVVMTGNVVAGGATLTGGVLTIALGNGNVATVGGVSSGTQIEYLDASGNATWTNLKDTGLGSSQAQQLVASMASYSNGSSNGSSTLLAQAPTESYLLASANH